MFANINFLLIYIQYLENNIKWHVLMLARYVPLGQMAYDDRTTENLRTSSCFVTGQTTHFAAIIHLQ